MSIISKTCAGIFVGSLLLANAWAQWTVVPSGSTDDLRGVFLLDSGVGYAVGDGGTILKSTDGGMTWGGLVSGTTRALYDLYFFNDSDGLAVGDNGMILRTTDGGTTWPAVTSGVRDSLRSISFSGVSGICGGLSQDIIYSGDSGATWRVSQKGFFGGGFFGAHMISSSVGFVTGQNSIFQAMQGTTVDGGVHWDFHPFYFESNEGSADDTFFFDNMTGLTTGVLFDGRGAIARTTDGGVNWSSTLFPEGTQGIDFPKPEAGYVVGFGGTILKSTDMGVNWSEQTSSTFVDLFDVHFMSDGLTGLAVGAGGTILRTTNGGQQGGLELAAAASRKGQFEINLPLTGTAGIECRNGGASGNFQLVLTFNNELASVDGVATSCGVVRNSRIRPSDAHQFLVDLNRVRCNADYVTLTVTGARDTMGNTLPSAEVTMGLLLGDTNGDGIVSNKDATQVRNDQGQPTDNTNYREDVDLSGQIDQPDLHMVRSQLGTMLPP
jgi:photosystem II stability/assembly factor-like uncharacterized protein